MTDQWSVKDQSTARGRRSFGRRGVRNNAWRQSMNDEESQMRSQVQSDFVLPPGFSPEEVRARGRARRAAKSVRVVDKIVTAGAAASHVCDVGMNFPVVQPVNLHYMLPIHTKGFVDLCSFVYSEMEGELTKYNLRLTRQMFCLVMYYYLCVKLGRLARLYSAGEHWLPALESCVNFENASVPAIVARYIDCVGTVKTAGGVDVVPFVDVSFNNFGIPEVHVDDDVGEINSSFIPLALAGRTPHCSDFIGRSQDVRPRSFPERLNLEQFAGFPNRLAYSSEAVTAWFAASGRIKHVAMTKMGVSTDGSPSILVTREGTAETFVRGWSVEIMNETHLSLGALFGFHERAYGQLREARSLVWGQHFQTGDMHWANYISQMMSFARNKPP